MLGASLLPCCIIATGTGAGAIAVGLGLAGHGAWAALAGGHDMATTGAETWCCYGQCYLQMKGAPEGAPSQLGRSLEKHQGLGQDQLAADTATCMEFYNPGGCGSVVVSKDRQTDTIHDRISVGK